MEEALRAFLVHCFETLGVHRAEALILSDNDASIRLVRRLGFHCDGGPLRDYWKIGDRYASPMVYSLINGELDTAVSNKRWTASAKSKQSRRSP